jgi:hypothetical protein
VAKVKKIPVEIRDCRSRKDVEQALRDGACVRMERLAAMLRPNWSLGFYVDWEGDGAVAPNDDFVLESERIYATREVGKAYHETLSPEQIEELYNNATDIAWRWHERDKHSETVPSPAELYKDRKSGVTVTRDTHSQVTNLLADMRTKTRVTSREARVASVTTAPAAVVHRATFKGAVWMKSMPTWTLDPATLWPLTADASVKQIVFVIPEGTVVVKPSILRDAKRVLGKKPDLRATVDNDGLHLRWGAAGGLDLREGGFYHGHPAAASPKPDPTAVFVPLVEKAA